MSDARRHFLLNCLALQFEKKPATPLVTWPSSLFNMYFYIEDTFYCALLLSLLAAFFQRRCTNFDIRLQVYNGNNNSSTLALPVRIPLRRSCEWILKQTIHRLNAKIRTISGIECRAVYIWSSVYFWSSVWCSFDAFGQNTETLSIKVLSFLMTSNVS